MKKLIITAVLGAAFFMTNMVARAAPICLPRSELAVHLAENYGEVLIAQGLNNRGALIEVFTTKSRDRWTLSETDASGRACLIAAGEYWNSLGLRPTAARQPAAFDLPPKTAERASP
ncbi:hypothetical protein [Sneathiella sp. HT1-7]|uniref:hypothetical protein n=1 Tax=Sneathiella sp. HT1-7 TaxID=2887192 RepID=UPI001D1492CC|nr:hypothetical protein [Sneathiella sp. HT1-7]MCC3304932.1 hypothetical protein [Sneathiella sp. HT1-7]